MRILLKLRLLIGQKAEILPSDWLRGPLKIFHSVCTAILLIGVLTQEVYEGFRFNFGVGLLREVQLDGSAHARGL